MNTTQTKLTIGALAKAAEVNVETIRFYQRRGLLSEPVKPLGGIRHYSGDEIARVRFIKSAQRLGFSLDEVAELLHLDDGTDCLKARSLAEKKLGEIREKRLLLTQMETVLSDMVGACRARRGKVSCPMIASLYGRSEESAE
jgi:MerR family mercuric resistance operon transcriptional regulator